MPDDVVDASDGPAVLHRVMRSLLRIGRNRRDLFLLEAQEEWRRGVGLLVLAGTAALATTMAVAVATAAAVAVCLQWGRWDLLVGLTVVYLAGALVAGLEARRRLRGWKPFSATRGELAKDVAW